MPFDNTKPDPFTKTDLTKPTLEGLSWLLRHRENWKPRFTWDFYLTCMETDCGTLGCAVGVSMKEWPDAFSKDRLPARESISMASTLFGMSKDKAFRIFGGEDDYYRSSFFDITPEMVADKIDEYLRAK